MKNRFIEEFPETRAVDVVISGSVKFQDRWPGLAAELENAGITVDYPTIDEYDWDKMSREEIIENKGRLMRGHLAKISLASVLLVTNYDKNGKRDYIGANVSLEIAATYMIEKPIYLLNGIPEQDNTDEIVSLEPTVLNGDIGRLVDDIRKMKLERGGVEG